MPIAFLRHISALGLARDEGRLNRRFHLKPMDVRTYAENVAFCMAADTGLGLSPTRQNLNSSMPRLGFEIKKTFETSLDALELHQTCTLGDSDAGWRIQDFHLRPPALPRVLCNLCSIA